MYFNFHIRVARLTITLRKLASLLVALIVFSTPQAWAGTKTSGVQEMAGKITGYGSSIPQQPAVSDLWKVHRTCRYYAKKAIQDQINNIKYGCGYSGVRWRLDFTNHYNWCMAADSRSRNIEISTRSSKLSNCPKGDIKTKPNAGICSAYANLAIAQRQSMSRLKCSISGSLWHSNYDNHYNLCMRIKSVRNVEQKTNKRQSIIAKCAEDKEHNPCSTFANRAVQDGVANQRVSCGGTGERWQIDWNAQYAWCRAATIEGRTHETTARRDAIAQCFRTGVMGDPVACRTYATDGVAHWRTNLERCSRGGFRGKYWHGDYNKHYSWCIGVRASAHEYINEFRIGRLALCTSGNPKPVICNLYANTAIAQQRTNQSQGCGFAGEQWHLDANRHKNWCMAATEKVRSNVSNARINALARCTGPGGTSKAKTCSEYANTAIAQQRTNQSKGCGFAGEQWHLDANRHKNWCLGVSPQVSSNATNARNNSLNRCSATGGKSKICGDYANHAILQQRTNLRVKCNFSSKQWHLNFNNHKNWCMGVSAQIRQNATNARSNALAQCTSPGGTGRADYCRKYASRAVAQQQTNLRVQCGYSGAQWHLGTNRHEKWCNSAQTGLPATQAKARQDALAHCTAPGGTSKAKTCSEYANSAIAQQRTNQSQGCGFAGEQWHLDANRHKSWCLGVSPQASSNATNARNNSLNRCSATGGKAKICGDYANHAILQQRTNLRVKCNFSGKQWYLNFNNHKNWCMGVSPQTRQNATNARSNALAQCTSPGGTVKAKIRVVSATYGGNCGVATGNVTMHIAKQCNGKSKCRYTVDHKIIGDPTYGCAKTYVVRYRCGSNPQTFAKSLTAEAGFGDKAVFLECVKTNTQQPVNPGSPGLGRVWNVDAEGWIGTWTRRGSSNLFDGVFTRGRSRVTDLVAISIQGNRVTVQRKQSSDRNLCTHSGNLSANGRSVKGTYTCQKYPGSRFRWTANISSTNYTPGSASLGSVWSEVEAGIKGTWTRRGNTNTFDGRWENGAIAVLEMSINGNKVTIRRHDPAGVSAGFNITYEGVISTDGKSVSGKEYWPGGIQDWSAAIR